MEKTCANCGESYKKPSKYSQKQWALSKYCSYSCAGKVNGTKRGPDYMRRIATGVVQTPEVKAKRGIYRVGPDNPLWRGGISDDGSGYLRENNTRNRIHRKVMSEHLGRKLLPSEHVHHIDGDKKNNAIENLVLISASEHARLHHQRRKNG